MSGRIVLLTDFGTRDGYPAAMKGVIWSLAAGVEVADLTHEIPPQDVWSGALTLGRVAPYCPPGTIFVAVVDPGVGTARRALAARLGEQFFVVPDNGLLSLPLVAAEQAGAPVEIVELNRPRYWRQPVSRTFHGRDVFAPAAAHLANGVLLSELGDPAGAVLRLYLPQPQAVADGWLGEVIHVDAFGNLATNLRAEHLAGPEICLKVGSQEVSEVVQAYGERPAGTLVALIDSGGALSIGEVNGSAARRLGLGVGAPVRIEVTHPPAPAL